MQEEVWGVAAQLVGLGLGVLLLVSAGILHQPVTIFDLRTFAKYFMLNHSALEWYRTLQ